jgi:hypothetical protein
MEKLLQKQSPSTASFKDYVFTHNKVYLLIISGILLLEFVIFKILYPFPDFFSDSYSYIRAAYFHFDVNIWPIGYSRFLAMFHHWISHSGSALITFQYLAWCASALYFYFTLTYFYPTGKNTRIFLNLFLFFNPLIFYTTNYVTSDILFISMSTVWLTLLIWILNRPRLAHVLIQAVLMFILFTFRYNAMLYPVIAAGVILLSKLRPWVKAIGVIAGPVLIIPFIIWSAQAAKVITGAAQFPPILGGWQWGNNALYFRGFIQEDSAIFPTPQTRELDGIARRFFSLPYRPQDQLADEVANYFIRHPEAPLKQYMGRHYQPKNEYESVAAWGESAIVFDQYGKFLIKRHPLAYARYYLLVNTKNYFIPPLEKLEIYNLGEDAMWPEAQGWFEYPSPKIWCVSKQLQGTVLALFPVFFLVLNLYYAIGLGLFIHRGGFRKAGRIAQYTIGTITVFLALNAAFSIFANIIVIRYEIFPMLVFLAFAMLLTDYVEILSPKSAENNNQAVNQFRPSVGQTSGAS